MSEYILVVDDEQPIAEIIKFNLEREGYRVDLAFDGQQAVSLAHANPYDLMILDVMLPKLDGFEVCRQVRAKSAVPILMLTAKEAEVDRVLGLELGADDYVVKPFSPRELIARVRAILRRYRMVPDEAGGPGAEDTVLRGGQLEINLNTYEVTRQGQAIELTPREFDLLKSLALHPGQVFTRENLMAEVWGYDYLGDVRTVDVTVRRLREKVEADPAHPEYVKTKRGVGYYFQRFS